jgi:hypothetical protein
MTKSPEELKSAHDAACKYPHTTADMFTQASLVRLGSGEIIADERTSRTRIETSALPHQLAGTSIALPTYNVLLPEGEALRDRIAIIGIGANCAPGVLLQKFNKAGIGGDFYVAQATLDKHAVAHSAFVGAQAYIPATVMPEEQSKSYITVGFYTPQQAEALTGTESNYDLVQKSGPIPTRALTHNPVLAHGALLYVSIWGAFTDDGKSPALQEAILQDSPHSRHSTYWTAERASHLTGYNGDILAMAANIKPGVENLETRLQHTLKLHPHHALPAVIAGTQVKEATLYKQAAALPQPVMLPRIKYL